ncbi:MAG: peptidoglycan DD-metalloendopeptidase family protein [Acidobacteria bacterium]|nr:peptidoglycan DD-metalloendopeptidase family protein [Acidobacteriota bacterium]
MKNLIVTSILIALYVISSAGTSSRPLALPRSGAVGITPTIIDYPGAAVTSALGIIDSGQIVGYYRMFQGQQGQGFLREPNGTFTTINFQGFYETILFDINESGQIVGEYWDGNAFRGLLYDNGNLLTINPPGATTSAALGINDSGQIVGQYETAGTIHGFRYYGSLTTVDSTKFETIDYPGATLSSARRINDAGDIVGLYDAGGSRHGFLRSGGFSPIDVPSAASTRALGINDSGKIVGSYSDGNTEHGFFYDGISTPIPIDILGASYTEASAINLAGQIVGEYGEGSTIHGFLTVINQPLTFVHPFEPWIQSGYGFADEWEYPRCSTRPPSCDPPTGGNPFKHVGFDARPPADDIVRASADGEVKFARDIGGGFGAAVVLEHDLDRNPRTTGDIVTTLYLHLDPTSVTGDAMVKQGDPIGKICRRCAVGPHLHFGFRRASFDELNKSASYRGALPPAGTRGCQPCFSGPIQGGLPPFRDHWEDPQTLFNP